MLKDRGNIKWQTSFLLPEHVAGIKQFAEESKKVSKPELDEQQLEEFERTICEAMEYNQSLTFVYWKNGFYETVVGKYIMLYQIQNSLEFLMSLMKGII